MRLRPQKMMLRVLLHVAFLATVTSFRFHPLQHSLQQAGTTTTTTTMAVSLVTLHTLRTIEIRGGDLILDDDDIDDYDDEEGDEDEDDDDEDLPKRRPPTTNRPIRNSPPNNNNNKMMNRKKKKPSKSLAIASSIARTTVDWTSRAAWSTLKGTGAAAVQLASPAHRRPISIRELSGRWRLDQCLWSRSSSGSNTLCAANVELTPQGQVLVVLLQDPEQQQSDSASASLPSTSSSSTTTLTTKYVFHAHPWPKSCRLEFQARAFQGPRDVHPILVHYQGSVRRKVADPSVLKIVGHMYQVVRPPRNGKPAKLGKRIGTFVARRRLSKRTERPGAEASSSRGRRQAADLDDDEDTEDDSDEGTGDLGDEEQDSNDERDVRDEDSDDHYEVDDDSDYDEEE